MEGRKGREEERGSQVEGRDEGVRGWGEEGVAR